MTDENAQKLAFLEATFGPGWTNRLVLIFPEMPDSSVQLDKYIQSLPKPAPIAHPHPPPPSMKYNNRNHHYMKQLPPHPAPHKDATINEKQHYQQQLKQPPGPDVPNDKYKTTLCNSFIINNGQCKYGDSCLFAHGNNDLRRTPRHSYGGGGGNNGNYNNFNHNNNQHHHQNGAGYNNNNKRPLFPNMQISSPNAHRHQPPQQQWKPPPQQQQQQPNHPNKNFTRRNFSPNH